jgi:predicted deacylase
MTTPVGEPIEIPIHDLGPRDRAPKIVFVSGIHGNELNGIFVLARLAEHLKSRSDKSDGAPALRERVLIIPAVNVLGLHMGTRTWPVDKTDINRMFPGYNGGETTQRIAAALFDLTKSADVRLDIHSSNAEFEELPQVRLYGSSEEERNIGNHLGLPAMVECPMNTISTSTLLHAWKTEGGKNLVIQAGAAGNLQMTHCDRLFGGLLRLLSRLNITAEGAPVEGVAEEHSTAYFPLKRTVSLISEKAGLFVPKIGIGSWIEQGSLLGSVYDGFSGRVRVRIKAPRAGFLTGLRYQALIYQGDLLARIQSPVEVNEGADTYLIGHGQ